jgi:CRP/FNR family transcriptional regulator, cyclic AMP receptor protein
MAFASRSEKDYSHIRRSRSNGPNEIRAKLKREYTSATTFARPAMQSYYAEIIGVAAAAASLYAAHAKTIIPLRIAAVIANLLAMGYSFMHGTYPTLVLNALLLPLNAWRLQQMLALIRGIDTAIGSDLNVDWLLKYMRPKRYRAGDVMMTRGEYATEAFYVISGEVEIVEIGATRGPGTFLGEIGLFTPNGRRTMTVRCKTDIEAATIGYDQIKELYFQNPQFGFRLLHLIVGRLQSNVEVGLTGAAKG